MLDAEFAQFAGLVAVVACLHTPQWQVAVELLAGMHSRRGRVLPSIVPFPFLFLVPHVLSYHTAAVVGNMRED